MDPSAGYDQQDARNGAAQGNGTPPSAESHEDADLFVEVEQQELAGSDQSEEFFDNAEASVTEESVAAECEAIEDDRPAEIVVEDDAHDEHRQRLEEQAMLKAIRQCVTDAAPSTGRHELLHLSLYSFFSERYAGKIYIRSTYEPRHRIAAIWIEE
ncbi:hypothetical protein ZWY2020_050944 [Hordeum vulgare]|nr:hypothetical protein ZWY2020_050944 [Hordeum vulgare]